MAARPPPPRQDGGEGDKKLPGMNTGGQRSDAFDTCTEMPISGEVFSVWQPPVEPGQAAKESCTMQAIIAGVVGGGAGMVLGAVLAPFNSSVTNLENSNLPMREQFRRGGKEIAAQSRSWGKNLLVIGGIFSCTECFVEKTRGRHDRWNPIVGGCLTGGILAASGACERAPAQ